MGHLYRKLNKSFNMSYIVGQGYHLQTSEFGRTGLFEIKIKKCSVPVLYYCYIKKLKIIN